MKKHLNIGLFGFGKTGKIVANELLNNDEISLGWVVRRGNMSIISMRAACLVMNVMKGKFTL